MRYCTNLIILFIALFPAKLFAQSADKTDRDITGLWKGTLYNDTTQKFYRYEIGISEEKGKLSGFSHTFFMDSTGKEYYGVKKVKIWIASDGKILVEDAGLIANNYPVPPDKGVRQLNVLDLVIKDSIMILNGPYSTNRTKKYRSLTGTINLQRKNDFWQSALVPHLQELGVATDLSFVKKEIEEEKAKQEIAKKEEIARKEEIAKKEEAAKIAAREIAANNSNNAKKEKATIEDPATKKEVKADATSSKEIASTKVIAKQEDKKETNPAASGSKDIAVNKEPGKKEVSKEPNTAASNAKEVAVNNEPAKKEISKETKPETKAAEAVVKTTDTKATENKDTRSAAVASKAELNKETKPAEPVKEIKPTPIIAVAAAEVAARKNVVQQTVYFSSDSLQLSLYDNGEVDGDTVSVLMNGKIIMAKEGLSTNAVRKSIYVGHDADSIELIMYAENLGSIAPNTGLLVVHDGKSIYEIRFSGDLKKNASIILRRRKN